MSSTAPPPPGAYPPPHSPPLSPVPVTPVPVTPATPVPPTTPVSPYDDPAVRAQLDDLQLQEEVVSELLAIIDEAGQAVSAGAPKWVDPDVFGTTREGIRMARHTVRAQVRVRQALDQALVALGQHHGALGLFRDEVRRVETTTQEQLAAVRARVEGVRP